MGMLSGHVGGPLCKLTPELLDVAERIARQEPLTLGQIARRVHELRPEAPTFSVDYCSWSPLGELHITDAGIAHILVS